ncbi:uncharacterized protein LOC144123698 [Amblyomma americanum]
MEKTEKGKINFSKVERDLLLDLVDKHKAVLENKRTDAVSVARKRKEWELIETQFNSSHNVSPRTWLQLKKCWENWKNKWRKAKADDNREIFKTGGGSAAPSQLTEDLQRVGSVASHMGVRLANPFDSDRHQADPGGESQPTPSVAALLSRTQDGSIPGASGDAEDPLWSWHYEEGSPQQDEQMEEEPVAMAASLTSATTATAAPSVLPAASTARAAGTSRMSSQRQSPAVPPAPSGFFVPATPAAAAPSPSVLPAASAESAAGTSRTAGMHRQSLVEQELAARLNNISAERAQKCKEHRLRMRLLRADHRDKLAKRAAVHQLEMENLKLKNDLKRSKKILLELQIKAVKGEL